MDPREKAFIIAFIDHYLSQKEDFEKNFLDFS